MWAVLEAGEAVAARGARSGAAATAVVAAEAAALCIVPLRVMGGSLTVACSADMPVLDRVGCEMERHTRTRGGSS